MNLSLSIMVRLRLIPVLSVIHYTGYRMSD